MNPSQIPALQNIILELLRSHSTGMSEYELIQAIRAQPKQTFLPSDLDNDLALFRTHFIVFHALYLLRESLWNQRQAQLDISPLKIVLGPYREGISGVSEHDPLRDYYLDYSHLERTSADDIAQLLGRFWSRLHQPQRRQQALKILGLQDPVDDKTIKQRYRRLAMEHHPDRGGDNARLQTINAAMEDLIP